MFRSLTALLLAGLLCGPAAPVPAEASVTLLIPSQPGIEPAAAPEADGKADVPSGKNDGKSARQAASAPTAATAEKAEKTEKPAAAEKTERDGTSAPNATPGTPPETAPAAESRTVATPAAETSVPEPAPTAPSIEQEVDVLMTRMDPFRHQAEEMSMPQLFAVLRFDEHTLPKDGVMQPERVDLLGDVEEAQYLDKKAWGANVALDKPGLYQFIIETRPWWNEDAQRYDQHYVKSFLPVYGVETGWEYPAGLPVEIVPLSRPFGLSNPCLFSGRVLAHGKPRAGTLVRAQRINLENCPVPSRWHEDVTVRTNERGEFALTLNRPGWWCCTAIMDGTPLKGHDGDPRPLQIGSSVWVYVDAADGLRPAQPQPAKKKNK